MMTGSQGSNHKARRSLCLLQARRALLLDVLANGSVTADDVWDAIAVPEGIDRRCLGSVPGPLVRRGIIRSVGRVPAIRPECHGSLINLWHLANREAAEWWLNEHPDPWEGAVTAG